MIAAPQAADRYVNGPRLAELGVAERPHEGFIGSNQVAANWTKILAGVPDLHAEILRHAQNGDELWSEWEMRGTGPTGATVLLRGPVVLTTRDGRISWARFYADPVTTDGPTHTTVSLVVAGPAERIFTVLRDPAATPTSTPPASYATPRRSARSAPS